MQFEYELMFKYKGIFFAVELGNLSGRIGIKFEFGDHSSGEAERSLSDPNDTRVQEIFQWLKQYTEYFLALAEYECWESWDKPIQKRDEIRPLIKILLKYKNTGNIREVDHDPEDDLLFQEELKEDLALFDKADRAPRHKYEIRTETGRNLKWIRRVLELRDGAMCASCGATENLEVDHIYPVSKGGDNKESNLQLLCKPCNMAKRDSVQSHLP